MRWEELTSEDFARRQTDGNGSGGGPSDRRGQNGQTQVGCLQQIQHVVQNQASASGPGPDI